MSEAIRAEGIQAERRRQRLLDWLATLIVAGVLAGVVALLAMGLIALAGLAIGDTAWHRSWVDQLLAAGIERLRGVPFLGPLVAPSDHSANWVPTNGYLRDMFAIVLAIYPMALLPAWHIGPTLIARYDDETLRAWPSGDFGLRWAGPLGEAQTNAWQALHAWCFEGAGTGKSPFWRPWVMPHVSDRFSIAVLTGESGVGKSHMGEALCREVDASSRLKDCTGRFVKPYLRARIKLREFSWWRQRQQTDPWDSGYLVEDPAARTRLAGFRPRRATLIVADELPPGSLLKAIEDLNGQRAKFRHPVRLLIIDTVLPGTLCLRLEPNQEPGQGVWKTKVQELGVVPVVSLSDVRFGVSQFRAMVGAQVDDAGQHLHLTGMDEAWLPLIDALDGQPVLLAEAVRQVCERKSTFDELRGTEYIHEQLVEEQGERATFELPPDRYGKQRDLMRERVLGARAQQREDAISSAVGKDAYFALLIASIAGGAAPARLCKMMGWAEERLDVECLTQVFGRDANMQSVPPIKPAVVADEMLRLRFKAPRGAILTHDARQKIERALQIAWLCNPGGTLRTVSRWAARRRRDDFVKILLAPPAIDQLVQADALPGMSVEESRVEIARAFFESAVFHGGDLAAAEQALQALSEAELERFTRQVDALLTRPEVCGLPALVLWLKLTVLRWPKVVLLDVTQTRAFGIKLLSTADHLARQARVMSVWEDPLVPMLENALNQVVPRVAHLMEACAADAEFRLAARQLSERVLPDGCALDRLRDRLIAALAAGLAEDGEANSGEPAQWAKAVMARLASVDVRREMLPDIGKWLAQETQPRAPQMDEARAWGKARLLSMMGFVMADTDPAATAAAVERVAAIAGEFPCHEGIQRCSAVAWRILAWTHSDRDPVATAAAAERVASIAREFPSHEGIQLQSAVAWRIVAWAHKDRDAAGTSDAVEKVAAIAREFPRHEGIQGESAQAWAYLAWVHCYRDPAATKAAAERVAVVAREFPGQEEIQYESAVAWLTLASVNEGRDPTATAEAAERVAAIAREFPSHEDIQFKCAEAWRRFAWSHKDRDLVATKAAAERVAAIARAFPFHGGIQGESAQAWRFLAWAQRSRDLPATRAAVERVAAIAREFPSDEYIQHQSAQAWRILAWAYRERDPAATTAVAERVATIAREFPGHEGIQDESAVAWMHLAWSHKDRDLVATTAAVERVAAIAREFPSHEHIQHQSAHVWKILAWAHMGRDPVATAAAAERVAAIASVFPSHEGIQLESAQAWRHLAWAHKNRDPVATAAAAKRVAAITREFPQHELIREESALAWHYALGAAVQFNTESLVEGALTALDNLAGMPRWGSPLSSLGGHQTFPGVLKERTEAYATYDAWRSTRDEGDPKI